MEFQLLTPGASLSPLVTFSPLGNKTNDISAWKINQNNLRFSISTMPIQTVQKTLISLCLFIYFTRWEVGENQRLNKDRKITKNKFRSCWWIICEENMLNSLDADWTFVCHLSALISWKWIPFFWSIILLSWMISVWAVSQHILLHGISSRDWHW